MNSIATLNAALQVIAALLIFVAAYLAFVISMGVCLVIAELISDHGAVVRDYGVRPDSLNIRSLSKINGETRR
jgi:hypothetical protein